MRIVAWNCCGGFARKLPALLALDPDLAVVCEVRRADLAALPAEAAALWAGDPDAAGKGLAILAFKGWRLARAAEPCVERWYLPVVARRGGRRLRLVGVWTQPAKDYVTPTLRALDALAGFLAAGPAVMAGDFNQSVRWDAKKSERRRFAHALARLQALGLKSAWHARYLQRHGAEVQPTYFHRWSAADTYHIDYLFASLGLRRRLARAEIGAHADWGGLSDHAPVIVDLHWPPPDVARGTPVADLSS
jgi:endonuclease/exonuclease/phosphatase family metal-dependent hydrolase